MVRLQATDEHGIPISDGTNQEERDETASSPQLSNGGSNDGEESRRNAIASRDPSIITPISPLNQCWRTQYRTLLHYNLHAVWEYTVESKEFVRGEGSEGVGCALLDCAREGDRIIVFGLVEGRSWANYIEKVKIEAYFGV